MKHLFLAGFDFGTSYSKVVLRDLISDHYKFVTFGPNRTGLLPSFVRAGNRIVHGPFAPPRGGQRLAYLKLLAADFALGVNRFRALHGLPSADESMVRHVVTGYFCAVLDGVRSFVRQDPEWGDYDPKCDLFGVQLAVPTGLLEDRNRALEEFLRNALMAATLIWDEDGCRGGKVSKKTVNQAWEKLAGLCDEDRNTLGRRCIAYPEVAAGVQAIFRMKSGAPAGKYITMDVGAGTVDLNAFIRLQPDEGKGRLDYWACEVVPLGASHLAALHEGAADHEKVDKTLSQAGLKSQLGQAVRALMASAFKHQPPKTIGNGGNPWSRNTRAYIFGGGSRHPAYQNVFDIVLREVGVHVDGVHELPIPSDVEVTPGGERFGRWAVAFGLSFPVQNLEETRLPKEIKTFEEAHPEIWEQWDRGEFTDVRPARADVEPVEPKVAYIRGPGTCPHCGKNVPHVDHHVSLKSCPVVMSRLPPIRPALSTGSVKPTRVSDSRRFVCPKCGETTRDLDSFVMHLQEAHRRDGSMIALRLNVEFRAAKADYLLCTRCFQKQPRASWMQHSGRCKGFR